MRLLELELERYGPFTARTVVFRPDARLHVVLGANEAGKSSALAAITDLLFGIETRTRHAHRHDMRDLRLGAHVRASDGRPLAFRRRKGSRNTLVDAEDAPLPEDALAPFLQGLTRDVFCRAFGLDAAALRQGGREMLDSEGEVGAILFAAASGLRGYARLHAALDEEANGIFTPRAAQSRSFYQALGRYEEARKTIRREELRAGDWRELNEGIEAAARRLETIRAGRARIASERSRLERYRRALPLLAEIDALWAQEAAGASLPDVSQGWVERLGQALTTLDQARGAESRAVAALAQAERERAAVPVDARLVGAAEAIFEAFQGLDRYEKDGIDLPRIRAEAGTCAAELDRLAVRVGLGDAETLRAGQPSDAARTRVSELLAAGREIGAALARLSHEQSVRDEELVGLSDRTEAPPLDPAPLRRDLKALGFLQAEVATCAALEAEIRRESALDRAQAARLTPPVSDLESLAVAGLPSHAAVAQHRQAFEALRREAERAGDRIEAAAAALRITQERLRQREAGRPIPARSELDVLRAERDALFMALSAAAQGQGGAHPGTLVRFATLTEAADRMADDLAADATRAAEQATDRARLDTDRSEHQAAKVTLAEIETRRAQAEVNWVDLWRRTGLVPNPPSEMAAWLEEVEGLLERQQEIEARRSEHAHLAARIEAHRDALAHLAGRTGLEDLPGLDAGRALQRIEERIVLLTVAWDEARGTMARKGALREQAARLAADLAAARGRDEVWRAQWNAAAVAIGLRAEAGLEEAASALEAWRAVPNALRDHAMQARRARGLTRDIETYAATVAALTARVAPDLAGLPPGAAMKALHGRLRLALAAESRRAELQRACETHARAHDAAQRGVEAASLHLDALLSDLPTRPETAEVQDLHARLIERCRLRDALALRRVELARATDGAEEAALRADLADISMEEIDATLHGLGHDEDALDQEGKLAFADRDRGERRRAELEVGTGAELALVQRKAAEAELEAEARRWAVLRLAHLMLGTAIARQRTGQQDPLLARAGAHFAAMTGGAFSGLAQDYDEGDSPRLVGRRASGTLVHLDGLSEGTRDQLYLAVRLAYLQDYAARAEAPPFVGDDLFLTFDDARTVHGLKALAEVGDVIQPILFTHHGHVADLARDHLGATVDIIAL